MAVSMDDPLIILADRIAEDAHGCQQRKYCLEPYITHPRRVAAEAAKLDGVTNVDVAAALLHDVVEDTVVDEAWLLKLLVEGGTTTETAAQVVSLVMELTKQYENEQGMSRAAKREQDWVKLRTVSDRAKRLKMLDRIDNLGSPMPTGMAIKYTPESRMILEIAGGADPELAARLTAAIEAVEKRIEERLAGK